MLPEWIEAALLSGISTVYCLEDLLSGGPTVWNLKALIWFPLPIFSLFFYLLLSLSYHFAANGPFSFFSMELSSIFH